MDTGKLLQVIKDIQDDESHFAFQTTLVNIQSYLTAGSSQEVNVQREKLRVEIHNSIVGDYVGIDYQTLENLGIKQYFGLPSLDELERILSSQPHEVSSNLTTFIESRQTTISRLETLRSSLTAFGLTPRVLDDGNFELAFSLPERYQDLGHFIDVVKDIKNLLERLNQLTDDKEPLRIDWVENGSIHLSIHAAAQLAKHFEVIAAHVVTICEKLLVFDAVREKYQTFTAKRRREMERINKDQKDEDILKVVENAISEIKPETEGEASDIRNMFLKMVKHFENGVGAEVRTPTSDEPAEPTADATPEEKELLLESKKSYEISREISATNRKLYVLQQNNVLKVNSGLLKEVFDKEDSDNTTKAA